MSTPIATSDDLATFLGDPSIDATRAEQLLGIAQAFCEDIVTPLPPSAFGIILSAAARTYGNPEGLTQESLGPYVAARPATGVYLTKSEKAALRRAAGIGGAGSTSQLSPTIETDLQTDLPPWDYDELTP